MGDEESVAQPTEAEPPSTGNKYAGDTAPADPANKYAGGTEGTGNKYAG